MKGLWLLAFAALLLAGCRTNSTANSYDPFLGRPLVPAPGTAIPSGPPAYCPPTQPPLAPAAIPAVQLPSTTAAPTPLYPPRGATTPSQQLLPPNGFNNSTQFVPQLSPDPIFTPGKAPAAGFVSAPPGDHSPTDNIRLDPSGVVVLGSPPSAALPAAPTVVQTAYGARVSQPAASQPTLTPALSPREREPSSNSTAATSQAGSQIRILASTSATGDATSSDASGAAVAGPTIVAAASRAGATYSYDANYQSLQGKLEHSQSKGEWKLRYIPVDGDTDAFGGSVVLASASTLDRFQAGDFVSVQGNVAQKSDNHTYAPLFSLARIQRQ